MKKILVSIGLVSLCLVSSAQQTSGPPRTMRSQLDGGERVEPKLEQPEGDWYVQGDFYPSSRVVITLVNPMNVARKNASVIIPRDIFPVPDIHEMDITPVDQSMTPNPAPSDSLLLIQGGHELRQEIGGHAFPFQIDDLDRDGVWDEIFFQVDLEPKETKRIIIYLGENIRGWHKHYTDSNVAHYMRRIVPWWETMTMGWKIWLGNSVDVYSKGKPSLVTNKLYSEEIDNYGIPHLDAGYGIDIQQVANSFGAGTVFMFDNPEVKDEVSHPRYTPHKMQNKSGSLNNVGQISDTRFQYETVVNGPLRSMIRCRVMNWNSGKGFYEIEQTFAAIAHHAYCYNTAQFTTYLPFSDKAQMGVGFRVKELEDNFVNEGGLLITSGPEAIKDPNTYKDDERLEWMVPLVGSAIVVPEKYKPQYQYVESHRKNHSFRVTPDNNNKFEFALFGTWSEGTDQWLANKDEFNAYCRQIRDEINNPVQVIIEKVEHRKSAVK